MENLGIRKAAKESGVKLWMVAEKLGIWEYQLSRKLRHELPDDEREKVLQIIEEIRIERETGAAS